MKAKSKHKTNRKGGKAITPTTPPETPRRAPIVAASRESRMIDTASLMAAPWNPRPTITPESVADHDGHPVLKYGRKESTKQLSPTGGHSPTAKELAERKEKRERNKAIRKLAEWCAQGEPGEPCNLAAHIRDWCSDLNGIKPAAAFAVNAAFSFLQWSSYDFVGTDSTTKDVARSALFGNLVIPSQWPNQVAAKIIESLNPSSNDWVAKGDALLVLRMLGDRAPELLGADVVSAILPKDADAASFRNPPIKWRGGDDKEKENAE